MSTPSRPTSALPTPAVATSALAADEQLAIEQQRTEQAQERTQRQREKEHTSRLRAFLDVVPILATMVTVLIALFTALQSQAQYRDTQAANRFQSAVEMLAGADLTTRVGGIALLGQVAQGSADRRDVAVRLLAAFMRVNSPVTQSGRLLPVNQEPPAEEARAVFAALAFRGDLTNVDMGRISARNLMSAGTDFRGLVFSRSDLSGGLFEGSDFTGDVFRGATLRSVTFRAANLTDTDFSEADVTGSVFQNADLSGADLSTATGLTSAMLAGATTTGTTRLPAGITVPAADTAAPPAQP